MKMAFFGLLVLIVADQPSIGVGLDVLPEAYTFAARRLNVFPDLRLSSCDRTGCRWMAGYGVEIKAYVTGWDLGINRLEAGSNIDSRSVDPAEPAWFEKSCQSIVALVLPDEALSEVRSIAEQIAISSSQQRDVEIRRRTRGMRFYGARVGAEGRERLRCGVVAETF